MLAVRGDCASPQWVLRCSKKVFARGWELARRTGATCSLVARAIAEPEQRLPPAAGQCEIAKKRLKFPPLLVYSLRLERRFPTMASIRGLAYAEATNQLFYFLVA
jgi:hypothetical protein